MFGEQGLLVGNMLAAELYIYLMESEYGLRTIKTMLVKTLLIPSRYSQLLFS